MGIGEWAALAAALMWTLSTLLWGKINVSALGLNLFKNFIAVGFIGLHLLLLCWIAGKAPLQLSAASWGWLSISGMIGIIIGDTLYFRSIQILGARRALMMAATSPLFAAVLGWLLLSESLKYLGILGIVLTVVGVVVVLMDRKSKAEIPGLFPGTVTSGVCLGLLAAVCQAVGGVFSKKGMIDCDPLEATLIRLAVAAVGTLAIVVWQQELSALLAQARRRDVIKVVIPATAVGTWLGIWLSQIAYKEASEAAIAQTLLATCPLFAIPIVRFIDGHRITLMSVFGTAVAIFGIFLAVK